MKKRLAVLMAIGLILGLGLTGFAHDPPTCPTDYPFVGGLELDFQTGGPCPSFFVADLGLMAGQFFHIGVGGSLGNIENQCLIGGYAKLGVLAFDIFKAKLLVDPCCGLPWYWECKTKVPFPLCIPCTNVELPFYGGFRCSESDLCRGYSFDLVWLGGISVPVSDVFGQGEVWLELKFSQCGYLTGLEIGGSLGFY